MRLLLKQKQADTMECEISIGNKAENTLAETFKPKKNQKVNKSHSPSKLYLLVK